LGAMDELRASKRERGRLTSVEHQRKPKDMWLRVKSMTSF
jgi:hypothetical protein